MDIYLHRNASNDGGLEVKVHLCQVDTLVE